jgi:hypothetical protein
MRSRLLAALLGGALAAALALAAPPAFAQGAGGAVIYVDADAAPGGDGTSWATAFRDLQGALAVAEPGDELWVAEGVYKPTAGSDRTATFTLVSGVALYGGFDGTEMSRDERDWTANVSALSGDIGVQGDSTDNAYHVVTANGVDATALLDGLTVHHGTARSATSPDDFGGGLLALAGSPTVRNCRFRLNTAWGIPGQGGVGRGGALYIEGGSPLVEDTVFEGNVAITGGAAHASGGAPVFRRVTFRRSTKSALAFADGSAGLVEDALFELNTGPGAWIERSSRARRSSTTSSPPPGRKGPARSSTAAPPASRTASSSASARGPTSPNRAAASTSTPTRSIRPSPSSSAPPSATTPRILAAVPTSRTARRCSSTAASSATPPSRAAGSTAAAPPSP